MDDGGATCARQSVGHGGRRNTDQQGVADGTCGEGEGNRVTLMQLFLSCPQFLSSYGVDVTRSIFNYGC